MGQEEESDTPGDNPGDNVERSICHIWNRTSVKFSTLCGSEQLSECITPDLASSVDRENLCPECLKVFNEG